MPRMMAALLGLLASSAAYAQLAIAIDGDTIAVGQERLRIIGMDTPETYFAQCAAERVMGYAAAGRLQRLLNTRRVRIERQSRDKYGRTLARIFVGGEDVAQVLIREGWARPYECPGGRCPARQPWCG